MSKIREPAVAGRFYSADADALRRKVEAHLSAEPSNGPVPKAMALPHASHDCSGPIAAVGYRRLIAARDRIERVVLLGPSHRSPDPGLAASGMDAFDTPLGRIPLDREAIDVALGFPQVQIRDDVHQLEHSLEVHLPYLQVALGDGFTLVPLLTCRAGDQEVADVLHALWGGPETAILVSTDLSHFYAYEIAQRLDRKTSDSILRLEGDDIGPLRACGHTAVRGLLAVARDRGLQSELLDLKNSGDTCGSRTEVVGYGAYAFD